MSDTKQPQPAAQAAGLTDQQIDEIASRWFSAESDLDTIMGFARALLSRAAPSGEPVAKHVSWLHQCLRVAGHCIDGGKCHHRCGPQGKCFRELNCAPLSRSGLGPDWKLPSAQQAEPGSPMKAAADALRWKTELEQAHQDGYRDGFKAAQAMLAKAEHPAEEARGVDVALRTIAEWPVTGEGNMDADNMREVARRALLAAPAAGTGHPDDAAVDRFAGAMKDKLAQARAKNRSGWERMDPAELSIMLREHVEKGDPRDVANFCMFLWHLGAPIHAAATGAQGADIEAIAKAAWDEAWELAFSDGESAGHPLGRSRLNRDSEWGSSEVRAALAAAEAQPDRVKWDKFPAWLIDHHEGDTITEELLQRALADMLKVHPPVGHSRQEQSRPVPDEGRDALPPLPYPDLYRAAHQPTGGGNAD